MRNQITLWGTVDAIVPSLNSACTDIILRCCEEGHEVEFFQVSIANFIAQPTLGEATLISGRPTMRLVDDRPAFVVICEEYRVDGIDDTVYEILSDTDYE